MLFMMATTTLAMMTTLVKLMRVGSRFWYLDHFAFKDFYFFGFGLIHIVLLLPRWLLLLSMLLFIAMFEMLLLYLLFTRKHISNHLLYIHLYVVVVVPHHISPYEAVLSNQPRRFHGWDGTLIQMDGWLVA